MTLVIKVVIVVLVIVVAGAAVLRFRKLRQDDLRGEAMKPVRLVTPPPSPYATSKGFRLVEDATTSTSDEKHATPSRPRLEPAREYVFGEASSTPYDVEALAQQRHDERWALSRSARRATFTPSLLRKLAIVLLILLVLAVGSFYLFHHPTSKANASTSTSSTTTKAGLSVPVNGTTPYTSFESISFNTKARTWASSRQAS